MNRRVTLIAAVVVVLSGTVTASADQRPPNHGAYLFTQQHRDNLPWWNGTWRPQPVPSGTTLQVQLPGDPIRWIRDQSRPCRPTGSAVALPRAHVEFLGGHTLPNDGRISDTSTLYVFDYRITGHGAAAICLYPDPVPGSPEDIAMPPGTPLDYTLTVRVIQTPTQRRRAAGRGSPPVARVGRRSARATGLAITPPTQPQTANLARCAGPPERSAPPSSQADRHQQCP